jgi:beta-galactosidase
MQADQIPWNNPQWHPPLGGIYRNVRLYVTDPLHITLPIYDFLQTVGPYVYATDISRQSAAVTVEVPVRNDRAADARKSPCGRRFWIHAGNAVATLEQPEEIAAGAQTTARLSGTIAGPQLWEPDYPYLYHVVCSVRSGAATIDSSEVPLGIRAVHWDIRTGFWINGHHLKLHGWGQRRRMNGPAWAQRSRIGCTYYTLQFDERGGRQFYSLGTLRLVGRHMIQAGDELGLGHRSAGRGWRIRHGGRGVEDSG